MANRSADAVNNELCDDDKLRAARLTRGRLWILCELFSALDNDELVPLEFSGKNSILERDWKRSWLGETQTPLHNNIVCIDREVGNMSKSKRVSDKFGNAWSTDRIKEAEERKEKILKDVRTRRDMTLGSSNNELAKTLRVTVTMLLVVGDLLGNLGEEDGVPEDFKGDNSLFFNAEVQLSKSLGKKNFALTENPLGNLLEIQKHFEQKILTLEEVYSNVFNEKINGKLMHNLCSNDARAIEKEHLTSFTKDCLEWLPESDV